MRPSCIYKRARRDVYLNNRCAVEDAEARLLIKTEDVGEYVELDAARSNRMPRISLNFLCMGPARIVRS